MQRDGVNRVHLVSLLSSGGVLPVLCLCLMVKLCLHGPGQGLRAPGCSGSQTI